jgi:hypothetical protein
MVSDTFVHSFIYSILIFMVASVITGLKNHHQLCWIGIILLAILLPPFSQSLAGAIAGYLFSAILSALVLAA